MRAYPKQTLVLMDVDCVVRDDITPVINIGDADVGITIGIGYVPASVGRRLRGMPWRNQMAVRASSRILVFSPTPGATEFALTWRHEVMQAAKVGMRGDEVALVAAYAVSTNVRFSFIDSRYSGREIGQMPDAVIEHVSAHGRVKNQSLVRQILRAMERPFRTGRTRASRRHLQGASGTRF